MISPVQNAQYSINTRNILFKMGKAEKGVNKEQSGEKELKQGETRKERLQEQQQKHSTLCRNSVVPFLGKQKKMAPNIKHKNTKIGPM
jgi:hypothetical protein